MKIEIDYYAQLMEKKVKEIKVVKGQSVMTGELLLSFE